MKKEVAPEGQCRETAALPISLGDKVCLQLASL